MRVLVCGGAGFVGSHLCDELLAHNYEVVVLDNLDPQVHGGQWNDLRAPQYLDSKVEFIQGDIRNQWSVQKALHGVDVVVHLAAKVGVGQSTYEMVGYTHANTCGTACLLEEIQRVKLRKLIVASSMSVYGEGECADDEDPHRFPENFEKYGFDPCWPDGVPYQFVPTTEYKKISLQSIYALTKYDQERMCLLWGRAYNIPTIALRLFNVYGSRQSLSNPYTGVIAIFASRLLNNKPPIIFEDGQQRRDFVHVSDVVRGIRLALESDISDEVINIGSGQSWSVLEVAERLSNVLWKDIKPEITGQHRVGDIRHCFADITKARQLLGYAPQHGLDSGLMELLPWLKSQTPVDKFDEHHAELGERGLLK